MKDMINPTRLILIFILVSVTSAILGAYCVIVYQRFTTLPSGSFFAVTEQATSTPKAQDTHTETKAPEKEKSVTPTPTPEKKSVFERTTLPVAGSHYCRNDLTTISWKVRSGSADQILITLDAPMPIQSLANVPASWNETGTTGNGSVEWKIGTAKSGDTNVILPDWDLYDVRIDAFKDGQIVETRHSGRFSIESCEG